MARSFFYFVFGVKLLDEPPVIEPSNISTPLK